MSISFIIPYYNLERHLLKRCIDCIRTLGDKYDWEIRVIDDGTPNTQAKNWVEEYGDPRLHYTLIPHSGPGGARNQGIEEARKEYLMFVDSDDHLFTLPPASPCSPTNTHSREENDTQSSPMDRVLQLLNTNPADALVVKYTKIHTTDIAPTPADEPLDYHYYPNAIIYMRDSYISPSACRYIIRKQALGDHRFTPNLYHEDEEFASLLPLYIRSVITTNITVYAYYQRSDSIINSPDQAFINRRMNDMLHIMQRLVSIRDTYPPTENTHMALERRICTLAMCFIIDLIRDVRSTTTIRKKLHSLASLGLYPLPRHNYQGWYPYVRLATLRPWLVTLLRKRR